MVVIWPQLTSTAFRQQRRARVQSPGRSQREREPVARCKRADFASAAPHWVGCGTALRPRRGRERPQSPRTRSAMRGSVPLVTANTLSLDVYGWSLLRYRPCHVLHLWWCRLWRITSRTMTTVGCRWSMMRRSGLFVSCCPDVVGGRNRPNALNRVCFRERRRLWTEGSRQRDCHLFRLLRRPRGRR